MQPREPRVVSPDLITSERHESGPPARTRHVPPLLPVAGLAACTFWIGGKLVVALLRRHWRRGQESPGWALGAATAGASAAPLPDLASLDPTNLAAFYLPEPALEALADCFAVVDGVRLQLHSQVLSTQSAVLRELFVGQREGAGAGETLLDLTPAFASSSASGEGTEALEEAACFLRLIYCPQEAHPASFAALAAAGWLAGVARLAHRLDAARLLQGLEAYVQALSSRLAAEQASLAELLAALSVAQACCMDRAAAACLEAVADKLAAGGGRWPEGQAAALAAFDPATLARLLQLLSVRAVGSAYRSPPLFDVRPDCSASQEGGFTWAIQGFSRLRTVAEPGLLSPWVEVGGFRWRLQVYPYGKRDGAGSHLSIFLCIDPAHLKASQPRVRAVTTCFRTTVLDQGPAGQDYVKEGRAGGDSFSADNQNWGYFRGVPLCELRRGDRAFLRGDRLLLRLDMRITDRDPL
ncbi:hypothetical protein ABPG75_000337 [Micractinium tetrahymenae]